MPVLESTERAMPRSALRHRLIKNDAEQQRKTGITPVAQRASRLRAPQTEEEERATSGSASTSPRPKMPHLAGASGRRGVPLRRHPLLYLGVGMIAMLALWTLVTMAISWWNTTWDDLHYGRPRTFQTDAVVGHNDSASNPSHFIAINLNSRIEIIEFPGGDGSKARIYLGPQLFGLGEDLVPVTLSFTDVNGDHRPDMIIHFQSTRIVFINDQGGFRPLRPDEQPAVEQFLQQHGQ